MEQRPKKEDALRNNILVLSKIRLGRELESCAHTGRNIKSVMGDEEKKKRRIFIAINVPDGLKNILEGIIAPFYRERFVRIPKRDGWHVTLVFCGSLHETEIERLKRLVERAATKIEPFCLIPSFVSFSPDANPRMVWLKFNFSPEFEKLKKEIEGEILAEQKIGFFNNFLPERRSSLPHLTLVRFGERHFDKIKKNLPEEGIDISKESPPVFVNSIDIVESELTKDGALYKNIFNIKLT